MTERIRSVLCAMVCAVIVLPRMSSAQGLTEVSKDQVELTVQVVDERGNAVSGARVALGGEYFSDSSWLTAKSALSDDDGLARLAVDLPRLDFNCVVAHHAKRGLIGFATVNPDDVPKRARVTLSEECRVTGRLVSSGLQKRNERLFNAEVAVLLDHKTAVRHWSIRGDFALYLPPGKYELEAHSSDSPTHDAQRTLLVPKNKCKLFLGEIELPVTRLKELEGQPAPELEDIVSWMNTEPLKLSDLRGKVVLLDFWGWWCGSCIAGMPDLFALHDKYHKDGLVIIGVHIDLEDSSVDSAEEMYEKVEADRKEYWKGREIPYPVAFVRSGNKRVPHLAEGAAETARCELAAKYGVRSYPTYVLIDREGRVSGRFGPKREEHLELLDRILAAGASQ